MSLFSLVQALIFVVSTEGTDLIQALMKRAIAHKMLKTGRALTVMLLLLSIISSGFSQGWEVTIGGDNEDFGYAILQTKDEGFVVAGYSESFGSDGDFDIYLVRTDVDGTLIWEQSYDEGYIERANDIIELEDETLLIVGNANDVNGSSPGTPSQVYLLNVSKTGDFIWSRRYENEGLFQSGDKIITTSDGGFAIIGSTESAPGASNDILLLKLDANADEEWREVYGTPYTDAGQGLAEIPGGFVLTANVKGDQSPDNDIAIYRVNEMGSLLSTNVYGDGSDNENVNDLIKTQDGNIILVGSSNNFNNAYFIKSDLNGDTLWTREINANPYDDELKAVTELEDGSVVATGFTFPNPVTPSILLIKMSPDGEMIWQNEVGEEIAENRFGEDLIQTVDGGLAIAGYSSLGDQVFINDLAIVRVDGEGNYFTNLIEGKVFWSEDGCNPFEIGDTPLADWLVQVEGESNRFIGTTDAEGNYSIPVDVGSYTVTLLPRNDAWGICSPSSFPIDFTAIYDTLVYNFPVRSIDEACSFLTINTSVGYLEACENATYQFNYCNDGSVTAENAEIEIFLDDELSFESTTAGSFVETDSSIVVSIGNLAPLTCGSFMLTVAVACEGVQNLQAVSVEAQIRPINECVEPDPNWDMSSITISGECENNEISFKVRNTGSAPTSGAQNFVIVEDVVMFLQVPGTPPIPPNGEISLPFGGPIPANELGSTYRLIAEQSDGHPGNNYLTVAVEGCTQEGIEDYNTGFVTQFPENDQDPYIDIYVQEILDASAMANLLVGHPTGYEDSIITTNTDIEYTVLFANSGSDTLNRLVIRDTLPAELDLATLSLGPASHPYVFELYNGGILKITFDDLNLIPADGSSANENSRGYVKFTLSQKPNLPLGTIIDNSAAVYFDYVAPEVTNIVHHVLACEDFLATGCITVDIDEPPVADGLNIRVQPNPFNTAAVFTVENCVCNEVKLIIRDAMGRMVRQEHFNGPSFTVQKNELVPALYFFEVYTENRIIQTGKLLVQ